jgi:D-tyrosyl-tRNA(Tyr) deacylase
VICVVQRVAAARVVVDGVVVGEIDRGLCVLAAIVTADTDDDLRWTLDKLLTLRVFPAAADSEGKPFDRDVGQVEGKLVLISNFTVAAHCRRGRRPSFSPAMPPQQAAVLFERFVAFARRAFPGGIATGRFGADMHVTIENDGPATFVLDSTSGE